MDTRRTRKRPITTTINGTRVTLCSSCYQALRRVGIVQARKYTPRKQKP